MAYWWDGDDTERFWTEIRWIQGIGRSLICPAPPTDGTKRNPWYQLVGQVQPGDMVYHWNAREHRFVGRSWVSSNVQEVGADWVVELHGFTPIGVPVTLARVRELAPELIAIRDRLTESHADTPLYLPFQYRRDGLRFMSNYFAKLPKEAAEALFDETGRGEGDAKPPRTADGPPAETDDGFPARTGFLEPFRRKADTDYLARIAGGIHCRGRAHETLVNTFAAWLESSGYEVGRNAVVDLGLKRSSCDHRGEDDLWVGRGHPGGCRAVVRVSIFQSD